MVALSARILRHRPAIAAGVADSVRRLLAGGGIAGILGVHLWGDAAPVDELEALAREFGVALYYDASHAFGCRVNERAIGNFGQAEVFSFHETNILSTGDGGCIVTNDDALAAKFIAMRGDHVTGAGAAMQSATSRMSESRRPSAWRCSTTSRAIAATTPSNISSTGLD